ncbi:hypothetical protein BTO05_01415 [Winogradskyella sp. PC-19]|uniref:hypothetical protein n=1 Tax=unclassified Winogradskyella TaxID=2615021 RepID=UPI000B3CB455|nr:MULTISPECIES: hypothetical protein [unclassified Winogradskyella]ARV08365.1 hypothetical protein BTO05_01415 [Winogradskyella sp. PC-19]
MRIYIPENLDIFELTHNNPPSFKPYKLDKLCYILHLINAIPLMDKNIQGEDFVPINAKKLQDKIQNYKKYLNYLESDLQIIESDNHYVVGEKSKGFRFIERYRTPVKSMQVEDFTFRNKLKAHKNRKIESVKHLGFLTKWFNDKLRIDYDYIDDFLVQEHNLKIKDKALWEYDRVRKKYKHPTNQMVHAQMSAQRLKWQDYNLMLDDNVYRFHTNLTNMPSRIRNAVTYDGQKLISLDIKNSQPYLSTILLSRDFWIVQKFERNKNNSLSIAFDEPQSRYFSYLKKINKVFNEIKSDTLNISHINIHNNDSYIMLGEIPQSLINNEFQDYIDLVVSGKLYEFLEDAFLQELGIELKDRKEVKAAVFQVLFTSNQFKGQAEAAPKRLFEQKFKAVYDVFAKIKSKDKSLLPRLLQSIESHLMINIIAKRVSEEYPLAPIYTIHDSISTTEEYVEVVEQIMMEELTKAIGHPPTIKQEVWCKSNMVKHLETLKEKAKVVA